MSYPANKVARIRQACEEHGWEFHEQVVDNGEGVLTFITCRRDQEQVCLQWEDQRMVKPPVYTIAGYEQVLHNAKAALGRIAGEPDTEKLNRRRNGRTGPIIKGKLTINEESTDEEILSTLLGRRIIWVSENFQEPLSTRVLTSNKDHPHYKVVRNGKVRVEFLDQFGFRAVHLDKIVQVR